MPTARGQLDGSMAQNTEIRRALHLHRKHYHYLFLSFCFSRSTPIARTSVVFMAFENLYQPLGTREKIRKVPEFRYSIYSDDNK